MPIFSLGGVHQAIQTHAVHKFHYQQILTIDSPGIAHLYNVWAIELSERLHLPLETLDDFPLIAATISQQLDSYSLLKQLMRRKPHLPHASLA